MGDGWDWAEMERRSPVSVPSRASGLEEVSGGDRPLRRVRGMGVVFVKRGHLLFRTPSRRKGPSEVSGVRRG